ncbi:MAG TPA: FmdB family zinc ribbon protein [Candidatus Dormibacteraeota bacterium]|nr:FmdB family zinc ribbon protein [Candidatus Dormibacteraeota bacterium]
MPTYGYRCRSCGKEFDVWQRMSDEAQAECPHCGGAGTRLFFPAGIVFKGSGFYKTDSRGSSASSASSPTSSPATPSPAKTESSGGGTSPSTPAASAPTTTRD